jgi:excisionase family DNA binding protein
MSLPELEQMNERLERIENLLVLNKTVLNMHEAALLTGLSLSHLYKLTSTGGIPCYKPTGKAIYFNREELEAWMLRGRKVTVEEIEAAACTHVTMKGR